MNPLLGFLAGALAVGGIVMAITAFRPAPEKPAVQKRRRNSGQGFASRLTKRTKTMIVIGLVAGIIAAAISGVVVLAVVVPIAIIGLPMLLGKPDTRERDILSALESWSRTLAAASATGRHTLRDVITVTRTSSPGILRDPVDRMVLRMSTTWTPAAALRAFAEEMDSAKADEVVVYLIQAAEYDTRGLAAALNAIADNLASQVKMNAEVFTEREKPRRVMIQIAVIAGVTLALVVLFARTPQLATYATPLGQFLLVLVLGSIAGLMFWARAIGRVRPEARFLLTRDEALTEPARTEIAR